MMTRQNFVLLAASIAKIENKVWRKVQAELAAATCAASNARFDKVRFMAACGVK